MPRRHVYVRHLSWPGDGVERVAPPDATYQATTMFDPAWIDAHRVDCFHTHFGFGDVEPSKMADVIRALADRGIGLVHTLHDLENPHRTDPARHRAQLDLLVPAAHTVITLTRSAAEEIGRRWGRVAVVLPHPHVIDLRHVGRPRRRGAHLRIGLHCKDFRAGYDVAGTLGPLLAHAEQRPDVRVLVDVYPSAEAQLTSLLAVHRPLVARLRAAGRLVVRCSPWFTERRFTAYLRTIDVAVLPYRVGTHSGWAEGCIDVGTEVVVTDRTHVHDQHPGIHVVPLHDDGLDPVALTTTLDRIRRSGPQSPRMTRAQREDERRRLSAAHREIYTEAAR